MSRVWLLLGAVSVLLLAAFVVAWTGAIGPLVTCGADQAAVCVAWPGFVSGSVWAAYILFFLGIAVWQVWMWRRDGTDESEGTGPPVESPPGPARTEEAGGA